ncbi:MAG TPA: matrixin family metalloprotease [Thermoanaerobaculia bacterium]|nr:matrixin family metalloprotease [Thermoanaerobaculia bacterium]
MHRKHIQLGLAAALTVASLTASPAWAGGSLESYDITAGAPSPIPGHIAARVIPIRWDARCMPVPYLVNNTLNPVPNPLGAPFMTLADATTALQQSFDAWNGIRTSFIDMRIVGNVANPGFRGFDMKNELTFRTTAGFTAIASSPSVNLIADVTFAAGDDIDGDGDSDVSGAITVCGDADGDGDFELPAGLYKAGTILDNDVQFNTKTSNGYRFTLADADADTVTRSTDLKAIAVHEFGHSHGLSHVLDNQLSSSDGNGATMFPFVDTGDPANELSQRTPEDDDIAWSSYFYPEGSAATGAPALQPGDQAFNSVYNLIKGSVTHGVFNEPVAGASLRATNTLNGKASTEAYSGTTQLSYNPATGGVFLVDPTFNIIDGKYVLPVKRGLWHVGIEAIDGAPVSSGSINFTAQIGDIFGQQNFNEEFHSGPLEAAIENWSGLSIPQLFLGAGQTQNNVNFITNDEVTIANFGTLDFVGFTGFPPGSYYAVRVPGSQITSALPAGSDLAIHAMQFHTFVSDTSVVPVYAEATLAKGSVSGGVATVDLAHPLARDTRFIGQDNDFAPFYFLLPSVLGYAVETGIASGHIQDLFLVLRIPTTTPYPGVSALPPLIALDGGNATNDVPINGLSYTSTDGVTWSQVTNFNFRFSLVLSESPF